MNNKDTIIKTIDFIEDNLKAEISILDISREGCYSLYHFIRLFQSIIGIPPGKYLLLRRLTEAALEIQQSNSRISDIAYIYQFNSHENFARSFKKNMGINPNEVRKGFSLASLPLLNRITPDYLYQSEKARNIPPVTIELDERYIAGISFFIRDDVKVNDLSNQWRLFTNESPFIQDKIQPERFYQIQYWSESQDLGGLNFFIGMEVKKIENIAPQFVVKIIPKGKYLRFIHKGLANKVGYTYKYIYNQYLPETSYKLIYPFNFELYGEKCLGPYNEQSESEIYIPIEI